jgi:dephospho-CoA kinase
MAIKVGITGGIGSGKSLVCRIFESLKISVYYADTRALWLINNDNSVRQAIINLLGTAAYTSDGTYNRSWVAKQVFGNPTLLHNLNAIVHPRVYEDTETWAQTHQKEKYIIKEAALLNKNNTSPAIDYWIVVHAPVELRIARVLKRDPQRTTADIQQIIDRQMSEQEYLQTANFVIHNDESQLLIPQIVSLHEYFQRNLA